MDSGVVRDGFDHEVRSVPNVGGGAEKDRSDADGQEIRVERGVAEQEGHLDLFHAHLACGQGTRLVFLQREKRLLHRPSLLRPIRPAGLKQVLHSLNRVRADQYSEKGLKEAQVGGGIVEAAGEQAASPIDSSRIIVGRD